MNIVLIDDDQLVCMSLKMILEADNNIHVTVAAGGNMNVISGFQDHF